MPRSDLNTLVLGSVSSIESTDKEFLAMQEEIRSFYLRNEDFYDAEESGVDAEGDPISLYDEKRMHLARNLTLRNNINKYLEANKSKMTTVEYQAVVQAYDKLVQKCDEDFKGLDGEAYFNALDTDITNRIVFPDKTYTAERAARDMATKYYLATLQREYKAAEKALNTGTDEEKEAAARWKENVLKKLYSGTFNEDVDKFIKEDIIGKTAYNYCFNRFTLDGASMGYEYKDIDQFEINISAELTKQAIDMDSEANKIEIKDEADKQKALDTLYEVERIRDVANIIAGTNNSKKVNVDTRMTKIKKNLLGTFNNKLSEFKKRMEDDYNAQVREEIKAQLAEQDKRIEAVQKEFNTADNEFRKAKSELEKQEKLFNKAKDNYEKLQKLGFIDEDDRKVNEGVYNREKGIYDGLRDKHGTAASKASRLAQELERVKNEKRIMEENLEKKYKEKVRENPYSPKLNPLEEAGIIKSTSSGMVDGKNVETLELVEPVNVKINRIMQIVGFSKVATNEERGELLRIEEENFKLLSAAHAGLPVKESVGNVIEPGALALEERNRQLNQQNVQPPVQEEVPVKEEAPKEEAPVKEEDNPAKDEDNQNDDAPEEEEEIDNVSLDVDEESLQVEDISIETPKVETPSYDATHDGMVALGLGVTILDAAQKGVWGGSKEYDDIVASLKMIQELEEYQNQNADTFEESVLDSNRATILAAKKQLAVQMKHYISRKNGEKEAAESKGKKENKNSERRRNAMGDALGILEEHIKADEISMGIDQREKIYEEMSYEFHYLADKYKKDPRLGAVAKDFDELEADNPDNLPIKEIISRMMKTLDKMLEIISKARDESLKEEVIRLTNKLGSHYVKDVAEYRPEILEGTVDSFAKNNELLGTKVDISPKPKTSTFNSYDDVIAYNQRQMQEGVKKIFREEATKKNFSKEWALYEELDDENSYQFTPTEAEKDVEKSISAAALKNIYAEQLQKNNIIFDPNTINAKCDGFVNEMKNYKTFNNKFMKHLCSDIKTVETSDDPFSINMSSEKITQAKNAAFQETVVGELSKLTAMMKENKGKEEIQSSLDNLNKLENLSKMVGTQEVYQNKIKVNGQEIEINELKNLAVKKAQKQLAPKQPAKQKEQVKQNIQNKPEIKGQAPKI